MRIISVELTNFRNFKTLALSFHEVRNLILGANGTGKTNLLEAIYYLTIGRSLRTGRDRELIRFDEPFLRIAGDFYAHGRSSHVEAVLSASEKLFVVNGSQLSRVSDLVGRYPAVSLSLDDGQIVTGQPVHRRRFLDIALSVVNRSYLEDLIEYRRVLRQRNRALWEMKQGRRRSFKDIEAWDSQLVAVGSRIVSEREMRIGSIAPVAAETYKRLNGTGETLALTYAPSFALDGHSPSEAFARRLEALRRSEEVQGRTLAGPHRDELELTVNGMPIRPFGSEGQCRCAAIALRLAEANLYQMELDEAPVLLLDEVFAELDMSRTQNLMNLVVDGNQIFMATARGDPGLRQPFHEILVEQGEVR